MSYNEGESCLKTLALHEECLSIHLLCHATSKKNFKNVIAKVLFLAFPEIALTWWRFRHGVKMISDSEKKVNDNKFFADTIDTPKD